VGFALRAASSGGAAAKIPTGPRASAGLVKSRDPTSSIGLHRTTARRGRRQPACRRAVSIVPPGLGGLLRWSFIRPANAIGDVSIPRPRQREPRTGRDPSWDLRG
jgi:hypothetical protein